MLTLNALAEVGFDVSVESGNDFDGDIVWTVTARKTSAIFHADGRKKRGVGVNKFRGGGATIELAIENLIDNANSMSTELIDLFHVEPNIDWRTAKEFPIKRAA